MTDTIITFTLCAFLFFSAIGMICWKIAKEIDDGVLTDYFWPNKYKRADQVQEIHVACWVLAFGMLAIGTVVLFINEVIG